MGYTYAAATLRDILEQVLYARVTAEARDKLQEKKAAITQKFSPALFYITFTAIPGWTGKKLIEPHKAEADSIAAARKELTVSGWSTDRLARVWWLLYLPSDNRDEYIRHINQLFATADMNEQVALYSALPLYAYPECFKARTAEGLRNNIAIVLDTIMLHNPYPAEQLDETAWNQLVLKAFFTDKPVQEIIGLDERANAPLAHMLTDYAKERWAAGRAVNPQLWRPVGKFIDETIFPAIRKLFSDQDSLQQQAAALCCAASEYAPALALLDQHPDIRKKISDRSLTWNDIVHPTKTN